jgi:Flp pilus assembly pilin Flp
VTYSLGELIALPEVVSATAQTGEKIMIKSLRKMWSDDTGQDLAEYGLLLILIGVALVTGIGLFKNQISTVFSTATSALTGA